LPVVAFQNGKLVRISTLSWHLNSCANIRCPVIPLTDPSIRLLYCERTKGVVVQN